MEISNRNAFNLADTFSNVTINQNLFNPKDGPFEKQLEVISSLYTQAVSEYMKYMHESPLIVERIMGQSDKVEICEFGLSMLREAESLLGELGIPLPTEWNEEAINALTNQNVVKNLKNLPTYKEVINQFPDVPERIRELVKMDIRPILENAELLIEKDERLRSESPYIDPHTKKKLTLKDGIPVRFIGPEGQSAPFNPTSLRFLVKGKEWKEAISKYVKFSTELKIYKDINTYLDMLQFRLEVIDMLIHNISYDPKTSKFYTKQITQGKPQKEEIDEQTDEFAREFPTYAIQSIIQGEPQGGEIDGQAEELIREFSSQALRVCKAQTLLVGKKCLIEAMDRCLSRVGAEKVFDKVHKAISNGSLSEIQCELVESKKQMCMEYNTNGHILQDALECLLRTYQNFIDEDVYACVQEILMPTQVVKNLPIIEKTWRYLSPPKK